MLRMHQLHAKIRITVKAHYHGSYRVKTCNKNGSNSVTEVAVCWEKILQEIMQTIETWKTGLSEYLEK